jgi:hypothetical protein
VKTLSAMRLLYLTVEILRAFHALRMTYKKTSVVTKEREIIAGAKSFKPNIAVILSEAKNLRRSFKRRADA